MRRGALLNLLVRPLTIAFTAGILPLAAILLFVAGSRRPAAVIGVSAFVCALLGAFIGERMMEAARCSFAWTLPRYRRALLGEFVICGVAVSALAALVGAVASTTPPPTFLVAAVGFAAFSWIGALYLLPERSLLFPIAVVALFASTPSAPAALLNAPLATGTVALAVSALLMWPAFSSRTFRWSALTGPRQDGRFIWHEWPTMPWWPTPRTRFWRRASQAASRARYLGTSVLRGVVSSYGATKPTTWFASLALCVLYFVAVGPNALSSVRRMPFPGLLPILMFGWWMGASSSRGSAWRATLPWSRRHHFAVTYLRDLGSVLVFLLVVAPAIAAAGAGGDPEVPGAVGRAIAVTALFFPAIQWASGPPTGGRWPDPGMTAVLSLVLIVVFCAVFSLLVSGLPKLVSSGVVQAVVLGVLLVGSQVLNWRRLKGYFAGRDLVGAEL